MESDARYTWVGAALLALLAALVVALLWLRNVGSAGNFNQYAIHFEQQALDGLEVGAEVRLRGIRVGRVEDYGLFGDDMNRVRVQVRVDRRAALRTNTVAVVTRNFVTGIATITLINGSPPGEPLIEVPEGESLPVIGEGQSDLQEITGRVNQVGEMASVAIGNLNELLAVENRQAFMDTVRNLRDLAAGMNQRLATLDGTLQQIGQAAGSVGRTADQANAAVSDIGKAATTLGRAGADIAAVATQSGRRLDATLLATERAVADAQRAFARIAEASDALQKQAEATAGRLEQSAVNIDDQLGAAITELRLSMESGARVLDRLREPRAALLGPGPRQLGPGEKVP